ncbi:MAG: hypothetical protein IIZ59_01070, partial [Clostridia bacterium]|nr:hypothetical protein [Clostridia bacterium]
GKELDSYHIMYCRDTNCEELANNFYDKRRKTENVFGVINIIMIVAIMLGLIVAVFSPVIGNVIVAGALLSLSVTVVLMPFAPENFYEKWRIKTTTVIVRVYGVLLCVASIIFAYLAYYYHIKLGA